MLSKYVERLTSSIENDITKTKDHSRTRGNWNLVTAFPCKGFVLDLNHIELSAIIRQSISKRISDKHVAYLAEELTALANQSYCAVKKTSPMMEEVKYYAGAT